MTSSLRMYGELAKYYDLECSRKDYSGEVRRLEELARRFGRSGGKSWLDVACGTGRHLEILRRRHACVGVDASPEMLRVARRRLPGVHLVRGDMRTFRLGRRFDVVSCLFSAVAHLGSERDLASAFANFARHLRPGGVAMVEPWILPSRAKPGHLHLLTRESPAVTLVRLAQSHVHGRRTVIQYRYLIAEPGRGIQYLEETNRGLMVDALRLQGLMRRAGLRPRFLSRGFTSDRGLLLGVKPLRPEDTGRAEGGRRRHVA
ncbi:MAG TPA: methyltransferase domain-containing protein [Thermoplasmata archaeon]|nr:methyltransferase domain-containing protein [Thermoplasmata archaeon]